MATGAHIAAARELLDWRQEDLARAAGLHINTVARWEHTHQIVLGPGGPVTVQRMHDELRKAGVEITDQGVRLVKRKAG